MEELKVYKQSFTLTEGMFDERVSFTPYAVLDIFQEMAGRHANLLGCGTDFIKRNNLAWILAKQYFIVYKEPSYEGSVTAYTYPHKPSGLGALRETVIKENDEILIRGITLWVMVDLSDFSLTNISKEIYGLSSYKESYFKRVPKIIEPTNYQKVDSYKILKTDLDKYHHMNNAKYANFVLNTLDLSLKDISSFSITYHNQAKLGDDITLVKEEIDNLIILKGFKDEEPIFTINVERK